MPRRRRGTAPSTSKSLGVYEFYNDGWMLSAVPIRPPWQIVGKVIEDPATAYKMELYDVWHDWTQSTDVAAANPDKVKEMTGLMLGEFARYKGLADRCVGDDALGVRAPLSDGGTNGVYLLGAGHRVARQLRPAVPQHLLHDHGGYRRATRRRRRFDCGRRRTVWRVWPVPAEGQTGVHLQPGRPRPGALGRSRGALAR